MTPYDDVPNQPLSLDDEFADEDEPLDVKKYITPEYVAWLKAATDRQERALEAWHKRHEEDGKPE